MGIDKQKRFWMVYRLGGNPPRYQHDTRKDAQTEAKRLARLSPGERFVVLKAVDCFMTEPPEVKRVFVIKGDPDFDEIPF